MTKRPNLYSATAAAKYVGLSVRQMVYRIATHGVVTPAKLREGATQAHLFVFSEEQLADMKANGSSNLPPPDVVDSEYIMDKTGIDKSSINYHIRTGHLLSQKVGRYNVFWKEDADKFLTDWNPQGRGNSSD